MKTWSVNRTIVILVALAAVTAQALWSARSTPYVAWGPQYCVAEHDRGACMAPASCTYVGLEGRKTIILFDTAGYCPPVKLIRWGQSSYFDPRDVCKPGEKPYGLAGPVDPAQPYVNCKGWFPPGFRLRR